MRIFVSYSHNDEGLARTLAQSLSNEGWEIWLDVKDTLAGMNWSSAIQEGLHTCEVMLVVIAPESMTSTNVEDEWQYFRDNGKPIIPLLWRNASILYQLLRLQYVDFVNQSYEIAFEILFRALAEVILPNADLEHFCNRQSPRNAELCGAMIIYS